MGVQVNFSGPKLSTNLVQVQMSADAVNRLLWGPKLWRLLHLAAEASDRTDITLLWKTLFKWTAEILPCELCRTHLRQYLSNNASFTSRSVPKKGPEIRLFIRLFVRTLHNDVNIRLEKPEFTEENLAEMYGTKSREEILTEARSIFLELKELWQPLVGFQIHGTAFGEWKKAGALLLALLAGGAN